MVTGQVRQQLRWYDIDAEDVSLARAWDELLHGTDRDVAEDAAFCRGIAGRALARGLQRDHAGTEAAWHGSGDEWPGLLELTQPAANAERHVLVLAEQSSMDPRVVWPVRVPVDELQSWEYDAVVWCYVPKRPALEGADDRALGRGVTLAGWAWADEAMTWQPVHLDPHPGHPFPSDVWQQQLGALHDPASLVDSLFAQT